MTKAHIFIEAALIGKPFGEEHMGDVLPFTGETTLDIDPDRILEAALGKLERVIIIGVEKDGTEYHASSKSYLPDITWDLERYRYKLMKQFDEE